MPRVSIGLPVYNGEKFLKEAIDSILSQTFRDFELVISDNASTDRTHEICESSAASDPRVRYVRNEVNVGAAKNYNNVFELSSGIYFKWAAHDDACAPDFLQQCVAILDREPSVVLCYPKMVDIDDQGHHLATRNISHIPRSERGAYPTPHQRFRRLIRTDYTCEEVFGVIRSDVLRKTKLILSYTDSDRTLLAELGLYGRFHEVPDVLFYHRMHKGMSTMAFGGWQERTAWFDPAKRGRLVFPLWRQFGEYIKTIFRVPLPWGERAWCLMPMGIWLRDNILDLFGELVKGAQHMLHPETKGDLRQPHKLTGQHASSGSSGT